jgi:hypothetical protein
MSLANKPLERGRHEFIAASRSRQRRPLSAGSLGD